ncbi:MAG: type VI secretion system tip protein VgrG [Polyangiaceae bacterium]|nr:type VI secretion system tip protein VgrG [Polyangiaceae bacterium]
MSDDDSVKNRLEFTLDVDGTALDVLDFDLVEQLNEISTLEVRVTKYGDSGDSTAPGSLVDKPAKFRFCREDGSQERFFHGFVIEAVRSPRADRTLATKLTIVPTLWNATKRADCRVFQEKSVVDIVTEVLTGAGVDGSRHEWRVSGSYEPRISCSQYRETDFDFIRRLLAEEGIWFSILMDEGKDLVVLSDDPAGLDPISAAETALSYLPELSSQTAPTHVGDLSHTQQVRSDKAFLRDYDPLKPKVQLEKAVEGTDDGAHSLEVYEYPGRFVEQAVCDHYTQVLLEQLQADRELVEGSTGVLVMRPGETFSVEEHPYAPLNQEYLLVRVQYSGRSLGHAEIEGEETMSFHGGFHAVPPSRVKYRPPRRERAVVIPGLQSGWTAGPGGEEIHVDESGQVKVHYHWDRINPLDDTCSQWMRSSQLALGGSMLLPRMNWEVTISHNEGDADKPVVMGRLYNPQTPPPYKLPDEKSKSSVQTATTPGGGSSNEFRMGDAGGAELMFFNASYDMTIDVLNNTTHSVGNDMKRKVGGNQAVNVTDSVTTKVGSNQTVDVGGNQDIAVETYMVDDCGGDHTLDVGGNRTMMIGGDHKRDVSGSSELTVNGMHIDLVVGAIVNSTLANHKQDVSAALVELTTADRSVIVGGMRTENTGAAKIIATKGGRGVDVSGVFNQNVGGAIITSIKGSRSDSAGATYTEIVGAAQVTKANDIVYEADGMITVAMGASVLLITPASVSVLGVSCKFDGDVVDTAITMDN